MFFLIGETSEPLSKLNKIENRMEELYGKLKNLIKDLEGITMNIVDEQVKKLFRMKVYSSKRKRMKRVCSCGASKRYLDETGRFYGIAFLVVSLSSIFAEISFSYVTFTI